MSDPRESTDGSANREGEGPRPADDAEDNGDAAEEDVPARASSRRRRRWLWIAGAVAAMAASVAGGLVWRARRAEAEIQVDPAGPDWRFTFPNDPACERRWFDKPPDPPVHFNPAKDPNSPNGYLLPRTVDEAGKFYVRSTSAKYRALYKKTHWSDYRFIWASTLHGPPRFEDLPLQDWLKKYWLLEGAPLRAEFARHAVHDVDEMARILLLRLLSEITEQPFEWEWARATAKDGLWVRQTTLPEGSPERKTVLVFTRLE